jgi:NADH-quinone oxidoreductase subunit G
LPDVPGRGEARAAQAAGELRAAGAEGQEIRTDSQMVKTAREGVMEFLLINHPLDCPICDQGGECDLQDQAMAYGRGASRYDENKRAVTEKYMGPLIKTFMTRCIHCTRCVRFSEEVAGVDEIGALYRGEDMQITTYLEQAAKHELSANVNDLCPVGALTHRPYQFEARPWELEKTLSIDVSDAMGSNIRVDSRGREVLRVLPRTNDDVNEEWLSDKARWQVEGLTRRRLDKVWIRQARAAAQASWDEAFAAIAKAKPGNSIAAVAGDLLDCETMFAAKKLLAALGSTLIESRQGGMAYPADNLAAVNFQLDLCGHRGSRRDPDRRQPRPLGSAAAQRAPAQWRPSAAPRCSSSARTGRRLIRPSSSATTRRCSASSRRMSARRCRRRSARVIVGAGGLVAGALGPALALAESWKLVRDRGTVSTSFTSPRRGWVR